MKIRDYKYTPEDVDCQYCTNFRHNRCGTAHCPWLAERVEAGVVDYRTAVDEVFQENKCLRWRLGLVKKLYKDSFWKDADHKELFKAAKATFGFSRKRNTNAYYAVLYLLTANIDLFRRTADCFLRKTIDFTQIKIAGIDPEDYALVKTAKCLYLDSAEVGLDEIADPEVVDLASFRLIINAMLIYRFGLAALGLQGVTENNGCLQS